MSEVENIALVRRVYDEVFEQQNLDRARQGSLPEPTIRPKIPH